MSQFDLLHLTNRSLGWARLARERGRLRLLAQGFLQGQPTECLDLWLAGHAAAEVPIYLYDSRPLVFGFRIELPRQVRGQLDQIIPLRIRQELGLDSTAIHWSARLESGAPRDRLRARVFVVRREALADIAAWQSRHDLDRLWVGCDLCAISQLEERLAVTSPLLVINAGDGGATCYYADGQGRVLKSRGDGPDHPLPSHHQGWDVAASRAIFGPEAHLAALRAHPALKKLAGASLENWLGIFANGSVPTASPFDDGVLLGGALGLAQGPPMIESLLAEAGAPPSRPNPIEQLVARISIRQSAALAAAAMLALAAGLWWAGATREQARELLAARAQELAPAAQIHRSQLEALDRIRSGRASMLPLFETVLEAAPSDVAFQRIAIAENGQLQIEATAKDPAAAVGFMQKLAASPLLQDVRLPEQSAQRPGQQGAGFKLAAQLRRRR